MMLVLLVLLLTGVSVAYPGLGGRCVRTGGSLAVPAPAPLTSATALRAAGPLAPLAPTSTPVWELTAIVLGVEVSSELEAVVTPTDQARLTALVTVMLTSVSRSVTVSLTYITGTLRSTTSPTLVVSAATFLPWGRLKEDSWLRFGRRCGDRWLLTAVVFRMIVQSELKTVVTPTDKIALTASMAVMLTPVTRSVTVSLSQTTGSVRCTTSPTSRIVPPCTPLPRPGFQGRWPG